MFDCKEEDCNKIIFQSYFKFEIDSPPQLNIDPSPDTINIEPLFIDRILSELIETIGILFDFETTKP